MNKATGIKLSHLHLYVQDLEVSIPFYERHFNLRVTERLGQQIAFLSADGMHHQLALLSHGPEPQGASHSTHAQCHVAFEVEDKMALASSYQELVRNGVQIYPTDHGISWALYFSDPDGNGLELYVDTREEADGSKLWKGINKPLYEQQILEHLPEEQPSKRVLEPVA